MLRRTPAAATSSCIQSSPLKWTGCRSTQRGIIVHSSLSTNAHQICFCDMIWASTQSSWTIVQKSQVQKNAALANFILCYRLWHNGVQPYVSLEYVASKDLKDTKKLAIPHRYRLLQSPINGPDPGSTEPVSRSLHAGNPGPNFEKAPHFLLSAEERQKEEAANNGHRATTIHWGVG